MAQPAKKYIIATLLFMKPRDAFGVGVRIIGLIISLVGAFYFLWGLGKLVSLPPGAGGTPEASGFIPLGLFELIFGLCLIIFAPFVVWFAYLFDQDSKPDDKP
jgi:hypothetical protein